MNNIYIYALVDPDSLLIRYIGKSIRPKERLQNHMNEKSKCHRCNWLQLLKSQNKKPLMFIINILNIDDDWQSIERFWIKLGRDAGWPLTNNTDGGDGVPGLPLETRHRI